MPTYKIMGVFNATGPEVEVEAKDVKAAITKAEEDGEVNDLFICHYCSNKLELCDEPIAYIVTHPDGEEEEIQL